MDKQKQHASDRPVGFLPRAFTLVELLVVISIIAILATLLMPSLSKAITMYQRRTGCQANQSQILKACRTYMINGNTTLPSVHPTFTNWADMEEGNPGGLWLLVKKGLCPRRVFVCPEARNVREWEAPRLDANSFFYFPGRGVSTLSYSYISMVRSDDYRLADRMTMANIEPTLVVLADQNPRCTPGTRQVLPYDQTEDAANLDDEQKRNSLNHKRYGQNLAKMDGSALWQYDPNDPTDDNDIYATDANQPGDELNGKLGSLRDPFLIP